MAADPSDIYMVLVHDSGPLPGECMTVLDSKDSISTSLLKGFVPGRMFEITKFDFGMGVEQQAIDDMERARLGLPPLDATASSPAAARGTPGRSAAQPARARPPPRRSLPGQTPGESPVTVQPIGFSRSMDKASSVLLHHCIKRTFFKSAALVKRKAVGSTSAGEPYLRLDFKGVLLIKASWSDDEPVEENYTFHARAITVRYRPQLEDGSLGIIRSAFWSMVPNEREAPL